MWWYFNTHRHCECNRYINTNGDKHEYRDFDWYTQQHTHLYADTIKHSHQYTNRDEYAD